MFQTAALWNQTVKQTQQVKAVFAGSCPILNYCSDESDNTIPPTGQQYLQVAAELDNTPHHRHNSSVCW